MKTGPRLAINVREDSDVEEKVQNALHNCSGGNFEHFIHKEFSDINPYYTILTINV